MFQILDRRAGCLVLGLCAGFLATAASAATITREHDGLTWTAQSTIVGVTPTGAGVTPTDPPRLGPGGDAAYLPNPTRHSGAVSLIMDYGFDDMNQPLRFICSGSLMGDRRSIVTAGHCVSDGTAERPLSTTAYFWDYATQGDERVPFNAEATAVEVAAYTVHEDYTGEVIDQNDIAVLLLSELAPEFAQSYDLYTAGDLTGLGFNVAGYGSRSEIGGAAGFSMLPSTGHLRQGDNRYDFRLGDEDFDGGWELLVGGTAEYDFSYLSDFDNGLAMNDASCQLMADPFFSLGGPKYCNTGVGALEVGVAPGDSGGPGFIDGKLASVNSYGLTFGPDYGDVDGTSDEPLLNSSFGEFSGYVPIFIHERFIRLAMVPEPSTWALLIGGFGLAGARLRRRKATAGPAAASA